MSYNLLITYCLCALYLIAMCAYTGYSIKIFGKALLKDVNRPYLGVSSTYLFNYVLLCSINLVHLTIAPFVDVLSATDSVFFDICSIIALYNGAIFLIKKYNFKRIKHESIITFTLQCCLYSTVLFIAVSVALVPDVYVTVNLQPLEYVYQLCTNAFVKIPGFYNSLVLLSRLIPLIILGTLWYASIKTEVRSCERYLFKQSANQTIFWFLLYQSILALVPFIRYDAQIQIIIFVIIILVGKLHCCRSMVHWMQSKDMATIEKAIVARGKR